MRCWMNGIATNTKILCESDIKEGDVRVNGPLVEFMGV